MAERQQETSVMVSIQEILRDAQSREEQEKLEAERRVQEEEQRRLDEIRRKQEEEAARIRAEEEERQRLAFEEQKRQAELQAVQEAALEKVKIEAESQARLAEIQTRQEHERQLQALSQDSGKKRLRLVAALLGVFVFVGAIGAGVVISNINAQKEAAERQARELATEKEDQERKASDLRLALEKAKDPAEINAIQEKLNSAQDKLRQLQNSIDKNPTSGRGGYVPPAKPADKPKSNKPCNCQPGDPLCSCL